MGESAIWLLNKSNVLKALESGTREDGRGNSDWRDVSIETDQFHHADGSAIVKLGGTIVAAGIKLELGTPYPDSPDAANLMVGVELNALASPNFETGPPRDKAIELSRVVDRAIREAKMVDLKKLVIEEGEKVWVVHGEVRVLNYDGNLFDACTLAVAAALKNSRVPKLDADGNKVRGEWADPMPLNESVVMTSFYKIGDSIVLDANLGEDKALDARLHVGITEGGNICALQKGGEGSFTMPEIEDLLTNKAVAASKAMFKELKKIKTKD